VKLGKIGEGTCEVQRIVISRAVLCDGLTNLPRRSQVGNAIAGGAVPCAAAGPSNMGEHVRLEHPEMEDPTDHL